MTCMFSGLWARIHLYLYWKLFWKCSVSKLPYVRRLARVARTAQASATWNQSQRAPKTLFISRLLEPSVVCMKDDNFSPNTCLLLSRQSKVQCKPKWRTFALLLQQTDFKGLRFLFSPTFQFHYHLVSSLCLQTSQHFMCKLWVTVS